MVRKRLVPRRDKMKRVLLFFILLLCLSGCTINYDLEVEGDTFKESVNSEFNYRELKEEELAEINSINGNGIRAFNGNDSVFHDGGITYKGSKAKIDLKYDYSSMDMDQAYIPSSCFESYTFLNEEDYYYLHVMGRFACMYGDKVNVTVKTNQLVMETNGKINGDRYTWVIDEENSDDVDMYIKISKTETSKSNSSNPWTTLRIIGIVVLSILCVITLAVVFIVKKNSEDY